MIVSQIDTIEIRLKKLDTPEVKDGVTYYYEILEDVFETPVDDIEGIMLEKKKLIRTNKKEDFPGADKAQMIANFEFKITQCNEKIAELQSYIDQMEAE